MNRKKKLIQLHKNTLQNPEQNPEKRLQNSKKPKYISKADRAKFALTDLTVETTPLSDEDREL